MASGATGSRDRQRRARQRRLTSGGSFERDFERSVKRIVKGNIGSIVKPG